MQPSKLYSFSPFMALILCLMFCSPVSADNEMNRAGTTETKPDYIEQATGLKKLSGDRFILDLKYAGTDNFLGKDVYSPFELNACYLHPEAYEKMMQVSEALAKENLYLIIYDCYRPLEVQKAMWQIMPDARYVANPATGSLHNRGVAVDCALADENGNLLDFPTGFDDFSEQAWQSYECPKNAQQPCINKQRLTSIMLAAGFKAIRTEWWHFQLPDSKKYPLLSLKGGTK